MTNRQFELKTKYIKLIKKSPSHWELIFNRPEKYNAINNEMYESITDILHRAAHDDELILLTITGEGKFYSSGTDLVDPAKSLISSSTDVEATIEEGKARLKKFIEQFITFPKILVAFVNGPAIGISVTTLALFDSVYASSCSTFVLPFTKTGQSAEGCSSFAFPNIMGSLQAKEMLLFGRKLTADEAQQRGLVTRVIPENLFQEEKQKICQEILSLPKGSLLSTKALIQRWNTNTLKQVNEVELDNLKQRWTSEEFLEAIMTFFNGRTKSQL